MARLLGGLILLLSAALLVPVSAQDKKDVKDKKEAKADKDKKTKEPAKADDEPKKDAKGKKSDKGKDADDDEPKKDAKTKKAKEPEEKVEYGQKLTGKLKTGIEGNSQGYFTLEIAVLDKEKVLKKEIWKQQELLRISQVGLADRAREVARYQLELVKRELDIYSPKDMELRRAENMKIRSLFPPVVYDDRGVLKKWTQKELAALKGNTKLPGYPADAEAVKQGQMLQVYLAKSKAPPTKAKGKFKSKLDDDDDLRAVPEVVMIVITAEPLRQPGQ